MSTKRQRKDPRKSSEATPVPDASPVGVEGEDDRIPPKEPSTRELVNPAIAGVAFELGEGD